MARTGFYYNPVFLEHRARGGHPECPERLEAILARLEGDALRDQLEQPDFQPADEEDLQRVHVAQHVELVRRACEEDRGYLDPDTFVCPESYTAALYAAGALMGAVRDVVKGDLDNAFCAVRPPGHHATRTRSMGFCLFNNVAVATRFAQAELGLERVLIVDWDCHHGNGTQAIFEEDPSVFYFSLHQYPFYPGTGAANETGRGPGAGTIRNVPLSHGSGDAELLAALEGFLVSPELDEFRPELVLISAGFDTARDDLIGGMDVTPDGFAALTRMVVESAKKHCQGQVVSTLEGGYNLKVLPEDVLAHVRVLAEA